MYKFGFATFDYQQIQLFDKTIQKATILDIGGGKGELSYYMLEAGAKHVTCLDQQPHGDKKGVHYIKSKFSEFQPKKHYDIALISWPINHDDANVALKIANNYKTIIVISRNSEHIVCGTPKFYKELTKLEITYYLPRPHNSLIIYNNKPTKRKPIGEESRGICKTKPKFKLEPDILENKLELETLQPKSKTIIQRSNFCTFSVW